MIGSSTWLLFGDAILTGALLSVVLPWVGVVLLLRRQLFLGAAIAQSGNLGVAVGLAVGFGGHEVGHMGAVPVIGGLAFAIAAGIVAMRSLSVHGAALEARAAWIFLIGGSGAMVLLADAPHGLQEVQRLMLSSLLGASRSDVYLAGGFAALGAAALATQRRRLVLWATDPATAQVQGLPVARFDVLVGGAVGAAVGFAIHGTGLPFTFGAMVLPVLVAREQASSLRGVFVLAPLVGLAAFAAGWWWADGADLPPGQCVVVVAAVCAALARLLSSWRRRR